MTNLAEQLTRFIAELDQLAQQAAAHATVIRADGEEMPQIHSSYFFGVAYGYEDTRQFLAELLARELKGVINIGDIG